MAGRRSPQSPSINRLTSQPETIPSCYPRSRHAEFQPHHGRHHALAGNVTAQIFYLKNRRPDRWRDVQNINADVGHYIISDRPMTEEQWITERTKVIEAKVSSPDVAPDQDDTAKPLE